MSVGWNLLLLVIFFLSTTTCAQVPKITSAIKEELLQEHEKHKSNPSFGLKQLQHAATLMHSLWHNGENIYTTNEQQIERYVTAQTTRYEGDYKEFKRDEIPEDQQLCAVGIPQYNVSLENTCLGVECTVQEVSLFLYLPIVLLIPQQKW
jgi:hypothetical protein